MIEQTGFIETTSSIPLVESLSRWRREARLGSYDAGAYRGRYFVWGQGQPLVMIHGLCDQARSFVPLISYLTASFRCIACELPTGVDGAVLGRIGHDDLANSIFSLLDHLQCGQACLYGASFGGTIALSAMAKQPRRFLRAAIQSSFASRHLSVMERMALGFARWIPGRMRDLPLFPRMQRRADGPRFASAAPGIWAFQQANSGETPIRAFAHRALMVADLDLCPRLAEIRHPILLLNGDGDSMAAQAGVDQLARGLPHADRLDFADCGHHAQYTHAAAVAESLRRFLPPPCGIDGKTVDCGNR